MFYKVWKAKSIRFNERNFFVILDTIVDLFFLIVPLVVIYFGYGMQISAKEVLQIIAMPSISLYMKLPAVLEQNTHNCIHEDVMSKQNEACRSISRRRNSLFGASVNETIVKNQNKYFPRYAKMMMFVVSLVYVVVLLIILMVQVSFLDTCANKFDNSIVWNKCEIKIPFCKHGFRPTCNCASLTIKNEPNLTKLPDNLGDEMSGLRKLFIRNCSLNTLPKKMELLKEMVDFEISFNKLNEFNVNITKWEKLVTLYLFHNNITKYDEKALWTHEHLLSVALNDNIGFKVPSIAIKMPSLQYLHVGENEMALNIDFNKETFPNLMMLFLNGNRIMKFPDRSLEGKLFWLGIARCELKFFPSYVSEFQQLKYLDARDNNITNIGDDFKTLIKKNKMESYFSGNPVCHTDTSLDCQPLCSQQCWSRHVSKNGYCDEKCNSEECGYDGGDCI